MGVPAVASPRALLGLPSDLPGSSAARSSSLGAHLPVLTCRDAKSWTKTIERLWADTAMRHRLRRMGRHWVEKHHRWSKNAARLAGWLERLPDPPLTLPMVRPQQPRVERRQAA